MDAHRPAAPPAGPAEPDSSFAALAPVQRPRRLRRNPAIRGLARETRLHPDHFVLPLFLVEEENARRPVASLPGVAQTGIAEMRRDIDAALAVGVRSFILFGVPGRKDAAGSEAWAEQGVVQRALRAARAAYGNEVVLIADACFCEYTDHGHCGCLGRTSYGETWVSNDATLENLARTALAQARAGADVVAPSGMIDGMIATMREALDDEGFTDTLLMSYAVKYASALYGPFRDAAGSAPTDGDRRGMQMDPANAAEALREAALDEAEGADILMVKPALAYLDVIASVAGATSLPVAAYHVSGEYAMVKAAAANGWIDGDAVLWEHTLAIRRAGARIILTYAARDLARWCRERGG